MENDEIRINGILIKWRDAKIIVLIIYAYSYQEIADTLQYKKTEKDGSWRYVNYTVDSISGFLKHLKSVLEVDSDRKLMRKALKAGFTMDGFYNGRKIIEVAEIV